VYHDMLLGEIGIRVHKPGDANDARNAIERAKFLPDGAKDVRRAERRGFTGLLHGNLRWDFALVEQVVAIERNMARDVNGGAVDGNGVEKRAAGAEAIEGVAEGFEDLITCGHG